MSEKVIIEYFTRPPFDNKRLPVFAKDCEDEGCKLTGDFRDFIILNGDNIKKSLKRDEKSVDRIIIIKQSTTNKIDLVLCELTKGVKKYSAIVEKIKTSGKYILIVLKELGFKIREIRCVYVGKYKNQKLVKEKPFSIPGSGKHNLTIKKLNCGNEFSRIYSF